MCTQAFKIFIANAAETRLFVIWEYKRRNAFSCCWQDANMATRYAYVRVLRKEVHDSKQYWFGDSLTNT